MRGGGGRLFPLAGGAAARLSWCLVGVVPGLAALGIRVMGVSGVRGRSCLGEGGRLAGVYSAVFSFIQHFAE